MIPSNLGADIEYDMVKKASEEYDRTGQGWRDISGDICYLSMTGLPTHCQLWLSGDIQLLVFPRPWKIVISSSRHIHHRKAMPRTPSHKSRKAPMYPVPPNGVQQIPLLTSSPRRLAPTPYQVPLQYLSDRRKI